MKKSMLNVIILALVLVNLVLTVILTFSLVSTNKKTNSLINKVAQIIDLDVAGGVSNNNSSTGSGIENVSYIDIKNNDSTDIIVSYVDNGKTRYAGRLVLSSLPKCSNIISSVLRCSLENLEGLAKS